MSLSYGEGVALGIHLSGLDSGPSTSSRDARRVRELEAMNARLLARNKELEDQLSKARQESTTNYNQSVVNARYSSAGLVVMNGMIRAMENLDPGTREKFRKEVVDFSQNRITELDNKYLALASQGGYKATTIMSLFSNEPQFKTLGFAVS